MAKYITWKDYYSVGEDSLDAQHQQIIGMINDLYVAMETRTAHVERQKLLDLLVQYTMTHFQHEEEVMQACKYPDFTNHKAEHDKMRRRTLAFRTNLSLVTAHDLLSFLKEWWTTHIQSEDRCYSPYLSVATRQGASTAAPTQAVSPTNWGGQPTAH
jgi:hemerythrin-like metal-binding protein